MKLPTVHRNGTSREQLIETYSSAYYAICDALRSVENVELNGRDYYPQGADAFKIAQEEHLNRCIALQKVRNELGEIVQYVMEVAS